MTRVYLATRLIKLVIKCVCVCVCVKLILEFFWTMNEEQNRKLQLSGKLY